MTSIFYHGPALFHVGYPKTASTFLQSRVFNSSSLGYGLAGGRQNRALLVSWFKTNDRYIQDPQSVRTEIEQAEAEVREQGLMPVWSEETLLGNPLHRMYDGASCLDLLKLVAPDAKVLITIRNQNSFALSAYREHLKLGRHPLRDFIGTGTEPRSYHPILKEDYLKFDRSVAAYQKAFGSEQVCVLPQELLRKDAKSFFIRLQNFTDRHAGPVPSMDQLNVGLGGMALTSARALNAVFLRSPLSNKSSFSERVVRRIVRGINKLSPATLDQRIEDRWVRTIKDRYAGRFDASNTKLEQLTGLDLDALGYQTLKEAP